MNLQTQRLNQKIDSLIDELLKADIADYSKSEVDSRIYNLEDVRHFVNSIEEREQIIELLKRQEIEEKQRKLKEERDRSVEEANTRLQAALKSLDREGLFEFRTDCSKVPVKSPVSLADSNGDAIITYSESRSTVEEWLDHVIETIEFYVEMIDQFDELIVRNTTNRYLLRIYLSDALGSAKIKFKDNDLVDISSILYLRVDDLGTHGQCIINLKDYHTLDIRGREVVIDSKYERKDVKICEIEAVLDDIKEANLKFLR